MKSSASDDRTTEDPSCGLASPGDRPFAIPAALALVLAAAAVWLTLLKGLDGNFVFIPFHPAVMLALVYGGVRAGGVATSASALFIGYVLIEPVGNVSAQSMNGLALAFFVGASLLVLIIAARFQRAQTGRQALAVQRAHDQGRAEALGRHIVERRRAEADLIQATAILRGIGQNSPAPIFAKDVEGRFLYANPAVLSIIGKSSGEVLGRTDAELHHNAAQAAEVMDNDRRIMRSGVPEVIEESWDVAGQSVRVFRAAKAPLRLDDGTLAGIVGVTADITERKAVEAELRMAKAEAERALLARSKFLAAASHDLRQPVQSLVLLLAVLKQHAQTPQVVKAADMMGQALEGLTLLLNSILDMSRLDAGVVAPQLQCVDLGALLERLARDYAAPAQNKGLKFRTSLRRMAVRTDPALLERALRNLIENALRYTERGGILIGLRRRGDRVRIDVFDTGVGVAADKSPHIFEEFFRSAIPAGIAPRALASVCPSSIASRGCWAPKSRSGRMTDGAAAFPFPFRRKRPRFRPWPRRSSPASNADAS